MKKLLLASMTLAMVAGSASAVTVFKAGKLTQEQRLELQKKAKKAGESLFMPYYEEEYAYENNDWVKKSYANYVYDNQGHELEYLSTSSTSINKTLTTFDSEGRRSIVIKQYADAGQTLANTDKYVYKYDPIIKDLVVEREHYKWNGTGWDITGSEGRTWKRDVTRDDKGNITQIKVSTYFDSEKQYKDHNRVTITYNEEGQATTWQYDEIGYVGYVLDWVMFCKTYDMEWYKTDGQITATQIDDFVKGNNLLAKAKYTEDGENVNTFQAQYTPSAYSDQCDYYAVVLGSDGVGQSREFVTVDETGSYVLVTTNCTDANGDGKITAEENGDEFKTVINFNGFGQCNSEMYYYNNELDGGVQYEMTYGEYTTVPEVWSAADYDYDLKQFVPFIKLVRSDYRDVTANGAVESIVADDATAPVEIYTIQGIKVSSDVNKLDAGIYIKKQGNKVTKFIK